MKALTAYLRQVQNIKDEMSLEADRIQLQDHKQFLSSLESSYKNRDFDKAYREIQEIAYDNNVDLNTVGKELDRIRKTLPTIQRAIDKQEKLQKDTQAEIQKSTEAYLREQEIRLEISQLGEDMTEIHDLHTKIDALPDITGINKQISDLKYSLPWQKRFNETIVDHINKYTLCNRIQEEIQTAYAKDNNYSYDLQLKHAQELAALSYPDQDSKEFRHLSDKYYDMDGKELLQNVILAEKKKAFEDILTVDPEFKAFDEETAVETARSMYSPLIKAAELEHNREKINRQEMKLTTQLDSSERSAKNRREKLQSMLEQSGYKDPAGKIAAICENLKKEIAEGRTFTDTTARLNTMIAPG